MEMEESIKKNCKILSGRSHVAKNFLYKIFFLRLVNEKTIEKVKFDS